MNVVRHAQAQAVNVSVRRVNQSVEIQIEDNGRGLDVSRLHSQVRRGEGFGLFSIRERLAYMGGSLKVESEPGRGTRVILTAPLSAGSGDTRR